VAVGLAFAVGLVGAYMTLRREIAFQPEAGFVIPVLVSLLIVGGYVAINRLTDINALSVPVRVGVKSLYVVGAYFGLIFLLQPRAMGERIWYVWGLWRGRA